jgi:hypothetical protein
VKLLSKSVKNCLRENAPGGFVAYCPACDQQYVIQHKTHEVLGTVTDIGMDKWILFIADEGELVVGQERAL